MSTKRLPKGLSIVPHNGTTIARLYNTNIVEINYNDNCIILRDGGYKTKHTKKCTNLVLSEFGINVRQKDFVWYVESQNGTLPYEDGMKFAIPSKSA